MGQFIEFSDEHYLLVGNVRHLSTNFISPQFYVVFDDLFEIVNSTSVDESIIESICQDLSRLTNWELSAEEELNEPGHNIYQPPPLHTVWLDEAGLRHDNKDHIQQQRQD